MKRIKRIIEVFELGPIRVEVEGATVAFQFAKPAQGQPGTVAFQQNPVTGVMGVVLGLKTAMKLSEVLNSALAQSGDVVDPTGGMVIVEEGPDLVD